MEKEDKEDEEDDNNYAYYCPLLMAFGCKMRMLIVDLVNHSQTIMRKAKKCDHFVEEINNNNNF